MWAHFMLGNTYPYTASDFDPEVKLAAEQGIDGFALNLGSNDWQERNIPNAYAAAERHGNFKMFISFDFAVRSCNSAADAEKVVNFVKQTASSPAQAKYNGKVIVSTFLGESCTFGGGSNQAWETAVFKPLEAAGINVYFVPFFSGQLDTLTSKWVDAGLDWNSAWPMGNYDITSPSQPSEHVNKLATKGYMAAVSPFFYSHFGPDTFNKNWLYRSDDWLYCTRWEQIIKKRVVWTQTEILTWNDWGESSYIGNIRGAFPGDSQSWVEGFPHTGLGVLTRYYATAFKTGAYPKIEKDSITMWSRPHAARAIATNDHVGQPRGFDYTDDNLYAVVLLTAPATVTLVSGSTSKDFTAPAGLSKIKIPSAPGSIGGKVVRNGQTVASYDAGSAFQWTTTPQKYNFNYFVGSSE